MPSLPSIENLFRFGTLSRLPLLGFSATLFELFGFDSQPDYPTAAVTRLVDNAQTVDGIWMLAEPVHLHTEKTAITLFHDAAFNLSQRDVLALAGELQTIFAARDYVLEVPNVQRWYLKLDKQPAIKTTPIHEVAGQNIQRYLITGTDKMCWDKLTNEIQMSLHNNTLNRQREQRGDLTINSLWFWGAGELPEAPSPAWNQVVADEVMVRGLSILTQVPYVELPENLNRILPQIQGETLIIISFGQRHTQYADYQAWQDFIIYLEQEWFMEIEKLLRQGKLSKLTLVTNGTRLIVNNTSLKKFWRRCKTLQDYRPQI